MSKHHEISVTKASDYRLSLLGAGAEIGGATVPEGQLGLYLGDLAAGGLLVVGTREELSGFVETARWHLVDLLGYIAEDAEPSPQCASCSHVEIGHAGPDGMCMIMVTPPEKGQSKGKGCPCVQFTPRAPAGADA